MASGLSVPLNMVVISLHGLYASNSDQFPQTLPICRIAHLVGSSAADHFVGEVSFVRSALILYIIAVHGETGDPIINR